MAGYFQSLFEQKAQKQIINVINQISGSGFYDSGLTDAELYELISGNPDVYIIENYLAVQLAKLPIQYQTLGGNPIEGSELEKAWEKPNKYNDRIELTKQLSISFGLFGNSYLFSLKDDKGAPVSFSNLSPEMVKIILDHPESGYPSFLNTITGYTYKNMVYQIELENIWHRANVQMSTQDRPYLGISKYAAGLDSLQTLSSNYEARMGLIKDRGALGFIANKTQIPDPDESKKVKKLLKEKFGLGKAQDKFIVTTEDLTWNQMSLGIQELQLLQNAKFDFEKLCLLSGIDPIIFSAVGSTYSNKAEAEDGFVNRVLQPYADSFYKGLSDFMGRFYDQKIVVDWEKSNEETTSETKEKDDGK